MEMVRCRCVFIHSQLGGGKMMMMKALATPTRFTRAETMATLRRAIHVYVPTVSNRTFGMVSFLF
jgi:hypothetical protein